MKAKRHSKIIEFVKEFNIETQEEIAKMLKESGFNVTQATVSRDIRELNLTKISTNNGKQKYDIFSHEDNKNSEKFILIFKQGVVSIDYAQNIVVVKTLAGMAMAVAAGIDSMGNNEILGSIAGDDNIIIVVKDSIRAKSIMETLMNIINT